MKKLPIILSWFFAIVYCLLLLLSLLSGHILPSMPILLIIILLIPPLYQLLADRFGVRLLLWLRGIFIPAATILFVFLIFLGMGNDRSIYKNNEIENRLMQIYQERLSEWPVPVESRFLETHYGKVFTIISGPVNAPPVFLLHASAMASWSWLYNIKGLSQKYRTYAIDTIGDAGRSTLRDLSNYPRDGAALARLYQEIMDRLDVEKAVFIGASQGGFIATNLALHAPERMTKLILCGPMGYTGTGSSVLRILFTSMFPFKPIQESAVRWAFGNDPAVNAAVGEWFRLILEGVISRQARPVSFTSQQLQKINMPVLMLLGKRDGLIGNPEDCRDIVKYIAKMQMEVLDTGHLISAEKPEEFNRIITAFIDQPIQF